MNTYNAITALLLPYHDTLANLRKRLLMRTGYSQQLTTPPPGIAALYNDYLQSAQRQLRGMTNSVWKKQLWFTWQLQAGVRFYDLPTGNNAITAYVGADALPGAASPTTQNIAAQLDPGSVQWVGISQGDNVWRPLTKGIDPVGFRASGDAIPFSYEFNNGIEIWPAPTDASWYLRIKGAFDLLPFTNDTDICSIDSEAVFLHALATVMFDKGKAAAGQTAEQQLTIYLGNLVGEGHGTARYQPGGAVPPPAVPPKMV
ncbi:MAG TPA: hypothetical protein VKA50_07385 [Gammaproteobacteria bacterium]|nr:hypothetical protein [Gammaproteobacteria bacterium]